MTARALSLLCFALSLVAIVYVAVSDQRWPLAFAATTIALGLISTIGALLEGPREGR